MRTDVPVAREARVAFFFRVQGGVRLPEERRILFDLDRPVTQLRASQGESETVMRLTNCHRNLVRLQAEN